MQKLTMLKDKAIHVVKDIVLPYVKNVLKKICDGIKDNKAASAGAAAVLCGAVAITVITGITRTNDTDTAYQDDMSDKVKSEWSAPSFVAEINGTHYEVKEKDGQQYLFKDGKKTKKTDISNVAVMDFNMDSSDTIEDISGYQDSSKPGGVGSCVYRGRTYIWERYLAYLKENGYKVTDYILTGSYADLYISNGSAEYRFLVVRKTASTSALVFDRYNGKRPELNV